MSLESDLKSHLQTAATSLYPLVGTRVEYGPLRQAQALPAVTWHVVTRAFEQPVSRAVTGTLTHLQFDCWDYDPAGAEAVCAALKSRLLTFTTSAHSLTFEGEWEVPEPEDVPVFHRALQVAILT